MKKGSSKKDAEKKSFPICRVAYRKKYGKDPITGKPTRKMSKPKDNENIVVEIEQNCRREFAFDILDFNITDKWVRIKGMVEGEFDDPIHKGEKVNICGDCIKASIDNFNNKPIYDTHQYTKENLIGKSSEAEYKEVDGIGFASLKINFNDNKRSFSIMDKIKNKEITRVSPTFKSTDVLAMDLRFATNLGIEEISVVDETKESPVCPTCIIDNNERNFSLDKKEVKDMVDEKKELLEEVKRSFSEKIKSKDEEINKLNEKVRSFSEKEKVFETKIKELEEVKRQFSEMKTKIENENKEVLVKDVYDLSLEKGIVPDKFIGKDEMPIEDKFMENLRSFSVEVLNVKKEDLGLIKDKVRSFGKGIASNNEADKTRKMEAMKQGANFFYGDSVKL